MVQEIQIFKKANPQIQNLEQALNHLKEAIESIAGQELVDHDLRELGRTIRIAFSNPDQSERMAKLVAEAYHQGRKTTIEVGKITVEISNAIAAEKDEKDRNAQWERSNDWKNWRHRTSRWILGAVLVVLMYSTAVWLHEKIPFVKVPVHDWITTAKNSQ